MKKRNLLLIICFILCLFGSSVSALESTTDTPTGKMDDYTNEKDGVTSKVYTFSIGDSDKYALGSGMNLTDMTWGKWLNIKKDKFNNDGYYVVTTNDDTNKDSSKAAYYVKYNSNDPYTDCTEQASGINTDIAYIGKSVTTPTLTCTGYTFNGWYDAKSGGTKKADGSASFSSTTDISLYAQWTANELTFNTQTYDLEWSSSSQTQMITSATNGTGNYTYSMTALSGFSIDSSTGTITVDASKEGGVYNLSVTAKDTNSSKEKIATITIRIKPKLSINVTEKINLDFKETTFNVWFDGLKTGATASSDDATFAIIDAKNMEGETVKANAGFAVKLNEGLSSENKELSFKVKIDNYEWSYKVTIAKDLKALNVSNAETIFDNTSQKPNFYINKDANFQGTQDDYFNWNVCDVSSETNCNTTSKTNVGTYYVNITPKNSDDLYIAVYDSNGGKTTQTVQRVFNIKPFELTTSNTTVMLSNGEVTYTGELIIPNITVTTTIGSSSITLNQGVDYTISCDTLLDAKTYKISIIGIGNYTGTLSDVVTMEIKSLDVDKKDEKDNNVLTYDWTKSMYWTGEPLEPEVMISYKGNYLVEDTDYTLEYSNNKDVGTGKITVTGKDNYSGTKVLDFEIKPNEFSITEKSGYAIYNGTATNGGANVQVNNSKNAKITYGISSSDYNLNEMPTYTDVGKYTVYYKVEANGFATKTGTIVIEIVKAQDEIKLSKNEITLTMPNAESITAETKSGKGVIFEYISGNDKVAATADGENIKLTPTAVGSAKIIVKTNDETNYVQASSTLYVTVKNGTFNVTGEDVKVEYDGNEHTIELNYEPSEGSSVTYSWEEQGELKSSSTKPEFTDANVYLISYAISKQYYDTYYGTNKLTISAKKITDAMVTLEADSYEYDGSAKEPEIIVKDGDKTLIEGTDYQVSYKNNVMPTETAKVIITGIGNYQGSVSKQFTITSAKIDYKAFNGLTGFTGYETSGKDPKATGCTDETCSKANVEVYFPKSSYSIAYSSVKPSCTSEKPNCSEEEKRYEEDTKMPTFKDVGTHTVYFRIVADGCETVTSTLTITITERQFEIPELFGDYLYTGQIQSPSWLNYNSKFMTMSGDLQATAPGTYNVTFSLTDKKNTKWVDGTTENKTVSWTINEISIKDHEVVVNNEIAYNEIKQLYVTEGRVTFDRTGYNQIAWVESCSDDLNEKEGVYDRNCDYSKYSVIKDNLENYDNETDCKGNGGTWITANGVCQKKRLNYYDAGSSFSGMYIADYLDYDTSKSYDLYAVWSKVTYKLEYDLCDSKGCGIESGNPTIVSYDSAFNVTNPERDGYLFMGWEITGMDETPHVIGEDTITEKSFTVPEEWIGTTQDAKIGATVSMKNLTSVEGATVKLKAIWQPIKYDVIFNLNKETFKDDKGNVTQANTTGYTLNMLKRTFDIKENLETNAFQMNGYDFVRWSTSKDNKDSNGENCTVYEDGIQAYKILENKGCLSFEDKQSFVNLSRKEGGVVNLYAQWQRKDDVKFTVTYWKQKIGTDIAHNSENYSKVGTESYEGTADSLITLTPYTYKGENAYENEKHYFVNKSTLTKSEEKASLVSESGIEPKYKSTTNESIVDDIFRGFTLQGTDSDNYNNFVKVECENENTTTAKCDNNSTEYSFILNPNGTLDINVYYLRNTYKIVYHMNGGTYTGLTTDNNGNATQLRQYQVVVTFQNPQDGNLASSNNEDDGGTNNSGQADFEGWFSDKNVTIQVLGENGEVSIDTDAFAKWLQYRYSKATITNEGNTGTWEWQSWGRSDE